MLLFVTGECIKCDYNNTVSVISAGTRFGDKFEVKFRNILLEFPLWTQPGFKAVLFDQNLSLFEFNTMENKEDIQKFFTFLRSLA